MASYAPYTNAASRGLAPGGNYGYDTGGLLRLTRPRRPKNAAQRGFAPGGNYGYNTGGPLVVSTPKPKPPAAGAGAGAGAGADADAGGAGTGTGTGTGGGYLNDPIYQQVVAIANQDVQNAQAAATAGQTQAVEALGDPTLAASLGLGKLVADTAQANPFSTLKNLLRGHNANVTNVDQRANVGNLWSSSTRTRNQQLEQTGYLGGVTDASARTQALLATIAQQLLAARSAAAQKIADAAAGAYGRHLNDPVPPVVPPVQTAPPSTIGQLTGTPGYGSGAGTYVKPKKGRPLYGEPLPIPKPKKKR